MKILKSFRFMQIIPVVEHIMAAGTIIAVLVFSISSIPSMMELDWSSTQTFYEFTYKILHVVIGIELVRMLLSHSIEAVLELLTFVVAYKMLKPDLLMFDVVLGILGFVMLTGARKYFLTNDDSMVHGRPPQA